MAVPSQLDPNHFCGWRTEAERLQAQLDVMHAEIEALKRHVFGKKSERVTPIDRELKEGKTRDREAEAKTRAARAEAKKKLTTEVIEHRVAEAERRCPGCEGGGRVAPVGEGKESIEYEYVAGYFRRIVHRRETVACACGSFIATAAAPERVSDKTSYGPGFVAHVVVQKCTSSLPIYRLEQQYAREGVPIARSTMNDLFHRAAELLGPIARAVLARIAAAEVVAADETTHRMQGTSKRPFFWTFLRHDEPLVGYRFSADRSGQTPADVLGQSAGILVVDAYTGYNRVTAPGRRVRAGCLAHARRKFFDALPTAPEAREVLDRLRDVYRVEHDALAAGLVRTREHLAMRRARSRLVLEALRSELETQRGRHPPKSPMGMAIRYFLANWPALTVFLDDVTVPPDNNASERALRKVALGRKNFLFVGHRKAGENTAVLYTLVASCEAAGVNPLEYLRDVLLRIQSHPQSRIDELMPHRWAAARQAAAA